MCFARISAFIAALVVCMPGFAFEIEGQKIYAAENESAMLKIISTADISAFEPIILEYQRLNAGVTVDYTIASSSELMKAIYDEGATFDLAISSAMDLQTKIANDGFAQSYTPLRREDFPEWANWRDQVFAFTQEPAVLVVSEAFFAGRNIPTNRNELINLLRENGDLFRGKIGTYDVRTSGLGYLFATQDSRNTESFWRLTEIMGRLDARLYCCSSDMISDVASGKLAVAYNVLGSYAASRLPETEGIIIIELEDYLSVMLRTALIPVTAENISSAQAMIDFLGSLKSRQSLSALSGLPPVDEVALLANNAMRPIRLGPGLLVFLDRLKRDRFLENWESSILQE